MDVLHQLDSKFARRLSAPVNLGSTSANAPCRKFSDGVNNLHAACENEQEANSISLARCAAFAKSQLLVCVVGE
jgi:hypothetical protein